MVLIVDNAKQITAKKLEIQEIPEKATMTSQYILLKTNSYIIRMNREDHLCWFHGKISRERAEEILREEGKGDGVFLVRECTTSIGDFVLSVLHQGEVWHYQIRRHGEDAFFSIDDHTKIHGLDSLIEHYQQASNGLVTQLSAIIKRDPPPNDSRSHGRTNLLHRATKAGDQKVVSELLKSGYRSFDAKSQEGQTAVHLACIHSTEEILKLLLNAGATVNCRDTAGNTPLHYACRSKPATFIRTLTNARANIQTRNIKTGCVPLHDAAKFGNMEAVKELLSSKAPHMPRTAVGEFPMDYAKESGHNEIVEFLQKYIPPPATTYKFQWYHGTLDRIEAIKLLQEYASTIKLSDKNGNNSPEEEVVDDSNDQHENDQKENGNKKSAKPSGVFLVRYSNRSGYVLTLLCEDQPKNFQIQTSTKFMYIDEGPYLSSLEHLVEHYMNFSDGLPVNLRYAVPPKPKPPLPLFSTMPKAASKKHEQNAAKVLRSPNSNESSNCMMQRTQRILSHPGDEAMNRVGLFEENDNHVEDIKKKRDMHIFRSLKPRSPKKNVIIDGMKSLRKAKLKSSPIKCSDGKRKLSQDDVKKEETTIPIVESLIKGLSFSTDFLNQSNDGFYNIPTNNCAVVDIDIGENDSTNKTSDSIKDEATNEKTEENKSANARESRPDIEEDYFTKSDTVIGRERDSIETNYFVDAPPPINMRTYPIAKGAEGIHPNFTGYVPTVDLRVFREGNTNVETSKLLDESAAELRELSKHPERLDSIISTTSTDSDFAALFNRQNSGMSSTETCKTRLNYFIPSDCLTLEEIIGEGEFGSVFKGNLIRATNENGDAIRYPVAIKTLRDEHCRKNKQEFLREASVMIRLQHHCIVKLIGISKEQTLMMVQELVPLGSMLNFIVKQSDKVNPNYELKIWASQIACGMNYLESQHFVHRDLAARNILLASRHQAKISDFGLSRALGTGNDCYQASQGGKWPIKWYAPESFNHGYFSHASDVWSFGVTLWEMFSLGKAPYGEMRGVDAIKLIEDGHRLPKPALCPDNVYKIMENCWNYKPKDRPTFKYLTEYFANDPDYQNLAELIQAEHIS